MRAITDAARDHDPVPYSTPSSAPPPLKAWETKRPESLAIFTEVREVINALSERLDIPAQNIINTEYARAYVGNLLSRTLRMRWLLRSTSAAHANGRCSS